MSFQARDGTNDLAPATDVGRAAVSHEQQSIATHLDRAHALPSAKPNGVDNEEVNEINPHTLNREFHGPTSSLAFLAALQRSDPKDATITIGSGTQALVSAFHNDSFSPQSALDTGDSSVLQQTRYYFRQSQYFLDGYFSNIHFIHPFLDRPHFLSKCEGLWFGRLRDSSTSFISLYFAVMSLGALTREWEDEYLDGLNRFEWSRKLFQLSAASMGSLPIKTDIETIQANIVLAKVCQNELNPHLAYMYLGIAVRLSLSHGINRQTQSDTASADIHDDTVLSKTWWGLYSIEMEMSFALGRPDSLGADLYHNRSYPATLDNETAILVPMVDFAKIIRKISTFVYIPSRQISARLDSAAEIEKDMDRWLAGLPTSIRPQLDEPTNNLGLTKDLLWAKKQRHTLRFRFYNAMMVLYRPFLLHVSRVAVGNVCTEDRRVHHAVYKCVSAAKSTIKLMHHMYSTASYFRTWYYNITYTLYASSILIGYHNRIAPTKEHSVLQQLITMSIAILQAMDENAVARKAAALLQEKLIVLQGHRHGENSEVAPRPTTVQTEFDPPVGNDFQQSLPSHDLFLGQQSDSDYGFDFGFDFAQLFPNEDYGSCLGDLL